MTRKRLLIGVLVTLAAIAALVAGTFAIFTDTEAAHIAFQAGTIDIDIDDGFEGYLEISAADFWEFDDFKPGDEWWYDLDIHNRGNNRAWIQVYLYPTGPWDVDPVPPDLRSCDPNPDCNLQIWGEAISSPHGGDWNRWWLDPSDTMTLRIHADFPQCMGNNCQGGQGDVLILVVAKQYRNKYEEGYDCVALEDKDDEFLPILDNDVEGVVCYKKDGDKLLVDVNAYGLTAGEYYQLSLNGTGGGPSCDNFEDVSFAGMTGSLYHSGWYYYDGMVLHGSCTADWHEGVWNFTGTDGEVQADASGAISWGGELTGLPDGTYDQVKFLVKHITGYADPPPGAGDYGTSWTPVLMEMDYLSFDIDP